MGGITGVYNYYCQKPVQDGLIRKMTGILRHRGPDEEGEYHDRELGLGHRRLSVVDVERGQQPQFNEDRSKVLCLDGEIYNYRELQKYLKGKGHSFRTDSDGEVILHLYEEKGAGFLDYLEGMFSLAIWDKRAKSLLLARDRLGIKPLYYYSDGYRLLFASEIKAIFQDKTVTKELNPRGVADYFTYFYIPAPRSIFLGVYKLPPGYCLICSPQGYVVQKYWDLEFTPSSEEESSERESLERYQQTLLDLLSKSVSDKSPSDLTPGLLLSGGIDSSALLALSHQQGIVVQTRTVGVEESGLDERPFARLLARHFHVPYEEWRLSPKGMLEGLDRLVWAYDEPVGDAAAVLTFELARLASQNMKVVLTGEGGDYNFVGYRRYDFNLWGNRLGQYLSGDTLAATGSGIYSRLDWTPQLLREKIREAQEYPVSCSAEAHRLLCEGFYHELRGYDPSILFRDLYNKVINLDPFSRIQYADMKTCLPDNVLTKVDRASMANSLEMRLPLLDHRLIEFLARMPVHFKIREMEEKHLLRKALEGILPSAILSRKKQDIDLPLRNWLLGEWRAKGEEHLLEQRFSPLSEVLNFEEISALWRWHKQGKKDYSRQIWAVLFFQQWYHQHMSNDGVREEDSLAAAC